ncbi:LysE family translocator [Thermogemmatispora tikiterensis]|uniref:Threonine transporter RhtB n=1 Tax=Thermogemmatispora tikiterensis TaxID=1825093 RepID=A0A328VE68_9CHLR|nr:LysE family translocator [Thermogemmatispora tikiterensis]RAQ94050.1 hypothetical protein A4R35_00800 [Thermogemmatispora tikiterensis]
MNISLLAFIGVATLITITPGADTMLVIRNVLARGQRSGIFTAVGICSGLFCHATLSALGLSLILLRSALLYELVKLLGAGYLCFLGVRSLWQLWLTRTQATEASKSGQSDAAAALPLTRQQVPWWRSLGEGFLSNVLNPKVAVFYMALLPQFLGPGDPVLAGSLFLAAIHFTLGIVWLSLVATFVGRFRAVLARPAVRRWLETVASFVLVAFGLRLALERR